MGEKEKKDEELEKENIISDIIFKGYGTKVINEFDKEWEFRTLSSEEYKKVWSIASIEDDDATNYMVLKKTMLQSALLSINHVEPTSVMKDKIFEKLPPKVIDILYQEYQKLEQIQMQATADVNIIKKISKNPYSKIKFKVNEEIEEEKKNKMKMDYLAYYINPEMAQAVRDNEKNREMFTSENGDNITRVKEHDEQNPYNPNEIIHYGDTIVDDDFDKKIKMFMDKDEKFTVLDDDTHKGNATESKNDFLSRVIGAQNIINEENDKIMKNLENDAKQAGVKPEDLDVIMVNDDEEK